MQAAAAALTVLGVFFGLDFLSAHPPIQNDSSSQSNETEGRKKNQPHILFILIDDQGFNDIGYHNPTIKTPTLDKLAAEGVKLENYYVQPICTPSRSQLITGRYQIHTGLQHSIIRPRQPSCLPSHMDTLPERLRQAGYATHLVGKWHLGFYRKACLPTRKGFDSFFGSLTGSVDYYSYKSCDDPGLCGYDLHEGEDVAWGQQGKYSTTLFTQRARKILESHDPAEKPLFMLLSLQAVHTPLQSPKSYIYPYRDMANIGRRKYAAMVSTVDEAVRNVTYALRKYGFYRNTVIIYSTDNGAQPFTGGSNWPLRGRKGTYWEGGIRGVAFVHSPLLRRRRRVSKALLHITDWFPTLVGLAGGNISQSRGLDGFDVWPTISEGKDSPRQEILHNIDPLYKPVVQPMNWKSAKQGASGNKWKGLAKKKTKKKNPRQQPKQKPAFQLKKKANPQPKSKPRPKCKVQPRHKIRAHLQNQRHHKPHLKSKSRGAPSATSRPKSPKRHIQPRFKSKPKWNMFQNQNQSSATSRPKSPKPHIQPRFKSKPKWNMFQNQNRSSATSRPKSPKPHIQPAFKSKPKWNMFQNQNRSSATSRPKSPKPHIQPPFKSKPKWNMFQNQNRSQLRTPQPKSKTKLPLRSKSRRTLSQHDNASQTETLLPETQPTPQSVWDTSVQAAIRVGDWKLLTGFPGHGDWVPAQVLPSLPGRWWNLERDVWSFHNPSTQKYIWLFNITDDPCERRDLADQRPDVVQQLLARLAYYNQTAVPVYFPPDDPRADPSRHGGAWVPWVDDGEEEEEEGKYQGVYKESKDRKKQKKKKTCRLCKLQLFFQKLNTGMMSNRI